MLSIDLFTDYIIGETVWILLEAEQSSHAYSLSPKLPVTSSLSILPTQVPCYGATSTHLHGKVPYLQVRQKASYAKKLQLLCVAIYLKVKFHSGEAENANWLLSQVLIILFVQQKSLFFLIVAVWSGSVFKCATWILDKFMILPRKIADVSIVNFFVHCSPLKCYHQLVSNGSLYLVSHRLRAIPLYSYNMTWPLG